MLTNLVSRLFAPRLPTASCVREITDWRELEQWRDHWTAMHDQSPDANFFQSWEWFETYWRHFGNSQQLRVLITEESDGTPNGILPLTLQMKSHSVGRIRRLGFPLENWGTSYGPLGPRPDEILDTSLRYLHVRRADWDVVDLRWIPSDRCDSVIAAFRRSRMRFQQKLWSRTARIDLSSGWDAYWNSRSSKWRNNQRRSEKLLGRLGNIRIIHFRPKPGEVDAHWDLYDLCEQVASKSWQGASPSGNTLNHPQVRDFLRDMHSVAVAAGRLYLSLLLIDEAPAAFTYNYLSKGIVHGLRMGYDLRFQSAGPGVMLLRETMRECCSHSDQTFDLGESPSLYKRHWENCSFETYRFSHYSIANSLTNILRRRV